MNEQTDKLFEFMKYREYPAYRDERKRHISATKNGGSILKKVPVRALALILLSINFVMLRPKLWPQYYFLCKS